MNVIITVTVFVAMTVMDFAVSIVIVWRPARRLLSRW
jgi:hypothetical protein